MRSYKKISISDAHNLYKTKITQLKMMKSRGYDITREKHLISYNFQQFYNTYDNFCQKNKCSFRTVLSQVYTKKDGTKCGVYYADIPKKSSLGKDELCIFLNYLDEYKIKNGILITSKKLSPGAEKSRKGLVAYNIQIYLYNELLFDPTEHYMVPKHELLSPSEVSQLLMNNNINVNDMPLIKKTDTIVRYLGAKTGDIIRIHRINMINGISMKNIVYRLVQKANTQNLSISSGDEDNLL